MSTDNKQLSAAIQGLKEWFDKYHPRIAVDDAKMLELYTHFWSIKEASQPIRQLSFLPSQPISEQKEEGVLPNFPKQKESFGDYGKRTVFGPADKQPPSQNSIPHPTKETVNEELQLKWEKRLEPIQQLLFDGFTSLGFANASSKAAATVYLLSQDILAAIQSASQSKPNPEDFTVRDAHDQLVFDGASYQDAIAASQSNEGEQGEGFDYPAAARAIHLWLKEYCNEDLFFPDMIADAARKAKKEIESLQSQLSQALQTIEEWKEATNYANRNWNNSINEKQKLYETIKNLEAEIADLRKQLK